MPNSKERDESQRPVDEAKGQAEEATGTTPNINKDEWDEGRSARERLVYEEKKAASLGPSGP